MRNTNDTNTMTEMTRINKVAIRAHMIDVIVMTIFCLLQAATGLQTWGYLLLVALLGFIPIIIEKYLFKNDTESPIIKYCLVIGFAIFYSFTLFTAFNQLVFVFVIPMLLITTMYNDMFFSLCFNVLAVIESFLIVIIGSQTGRFGYLGMDYGIIQIVFMILVAVYSVSVAKNLNKNSELRLQRISNAQNETELVLTDLTKLSDQMKSGIEDINEELQKLTVAATFTQNAMQEVSAGASDTASAVQNQLLQTEAIQSKVDLVDDATSHITENMQKTLAVLEDGNRDVAILVKQVDVSVQNSADVAEKLQTLDSYMKEMNTIVELINSIASQTSLLALNASIEAARAGEAGRGFSVVASEISAMATQTHNATLNITDLIQNVSSAITEVVTVIHQMIEGINEEKTSAENAEGSFNSIQTNTLSIRQNVDNLAASIVELKDANQVIVDSIQTISAVSEEVSAHSNETMHAEEENTAILERIEQKMSDLMRLINQ